MRYINRNRFVRGNTGGFSQGGGGNLSVYSQVIQLTRSIDIIQVIDDTTIQIASDEAILFPQGQVVLIEGSSDGEASGINDGLYEVTSIQVIGEDVMNISFTQANLTPGLPENGMAHIAQNVNVQHGLDTEDIVYRLKRAATGETTIIDDDSSDNNKLILKPQVPIVGDFRLTVFG